MLKRLKGWKTRLFNALVVIAPAVAVYVLDELGRIDWTDHVSPETALLIPVAIGAVNLVLRELTTGPAGGRTP